MENWEKGKKEERRGKRGGERRGGRGEEGKGGVERGQNVKQFY